MEDWEKETLIGRIVDHAIGLAVFMVFLIVVLRYLATVPGDRQYDGWEAACEHMRREYAERESK